MRGARRRAGAPVVSYQAMTWAADQKAGGPSAKAVLWAIADYANQDDVAWPSQKLLADRSEQSDDSVARRLRDLEDRSLLRCLPMKVGGRKTVDFLILARSRFFSAKLAEIEPLLPRGFVLDPHYRDASAPANCGRETLFQGPAVEAEKSPESALTPLPQTLPQSAGNAPAMVRVHEPVIEPEEPEEREGAWVRANSFDQFFGAYPTAAGDSRDRTLAAWEAMENCEQQEAREGLRRFLEHMRLIKQKHLPRSHTYLAERRWRLVPKPTAVPPTFIPRASPGWQACADRLKREKGTLSVPTMQGNGGTFGWWFQSDWPETLRAVEQLREWQRRQPPGEGGSNP